MTPRSRRTASCSRSITKMAGRLDMVSVPMQFDGAPLKSRPAPELGAHSEEILTALGYDEEQIIELKVAGVVF